MSMYRLLIIAMLWVMVCFDALFIGVVTWMTYTEHSWVPVALGIAVAPILLIMTISLIRDAIRD